MSLTGAAEYPLPTDIDEVELADEPIPFDVDAIRADFPILERTTPDGRPLVYLDSANSSQKPRVVVEAIEDHYLNHNANVARAMHLLGAEATEAFEGARATLAQFVGAARSEEIVFTKNASEALNLCAHTLGARLGPGDEIVVSIMEHHSNLVPWQLLAERSGATLRWFDVTEEGRLDLAKAAAEGLVNERTKIISVAFVSNVLGTVNPVREIAALGHAVGATVVLDASQAVPQLPDRRRRARRGSDRVHRAQDGRPDRHRRALGPLRPARIAAAVPRRRGDDRDRPDDRIDVRATAASLRGRYAADRPGRRPRRRGPLPQRDRPGPDRRARGRDHRVRAGRPARPARRPHPRADRAGRSGWCGVVHAGGGRA